MNAEFAFKVCRVCLSSEDVDSMSSLFERNGEKAEMLQVIAGIDVTHDEYTRDALICDTCMEKLKQAFDLRQQIREAEEFYFELRRVEQPAIEIEDVTHLLFELDDDDDEAPIEMNENRTGNDSEIVNVRMEESSTKPGQKNISCSLCNKVFTKNFYLYHHVKAVHEKVLRFSCDLCSFSFYHKTHLTRHLNSHIKNPNFKSKIINTSDATRPFKCQVKNCLKYFKTKCELKRHQQVHGDTKVSCWCGKSFKHKVSLQRHQKAEHEPNKTIKT